MKFSTPKILTTLAIFAYLILQIQHFTPAHPELDCDGYLHLAKQIARFEPIAVEDDPFKYHLHFWVETKSGKIMPKFSPGYPFVMAIFYRIGGDEAMFLVSPIAGILTLIGAFLLFRLWMSELIAALGVWLLAINAMWLVYPAYLLTHGLNTCAVTWGMFFLWRWHRKPTIRNGVIAGLLIGFAATIRPTSVLMGGVIAISIGVRIWRERSKIDLKPLIAMISAYAFFGIAMMIYNLIFFGDPLITGYGLSDEQSAFTFRNFLANFARVIGGLNSTALFLIFPIGIAGLFAVGRSDERAMRLAWFLPIFFLHSAYYWVPSGMPFLRFFICTFPVVIGSACMLLDRVANGNRIAVTIFVAVIIFLNYGPAQQNLRRVVSNDRSKQRLEMGRLLSKKIGSNAVIFSRSPFNACVGTRENFRFYDLARFENPWRGGERRHPIRTEKIEHFFKTHDLAKRTEMKRQLIKKFIDQSRQIIFVIPKNELNKRQKEIGDRFRFQLVIDWNDWGIYEVKHN